jgi:hypothetical protein
MSDLIVDGRLHVTALSAPFGLAMAAWACIYRRVRVELAEM